MINYLNQVISDDEFIDLLEQDEEVKLLNRTATPKSINLITFTSYCLFNS